MKITSTTIFMVMILMMMFLIMATLSKKTKLSREKNSPFECGFSNLYSARKPFSTHFFMIAMMFLIFDIEISMIMPMYTTKMIKMNEWVISSTMITLILIMGLYHEWKNGMLEWSK